MLPRTVIRGVIAAMLAVVVAPGCRREEPSSQTTVCGRVAFQSRSLAGGRVVFTPDRDRGGSGKPISAGLDGDGRFQLAIGGDLAIPPGWYRVAIASPPGDASASGANCPLNLARPDRSGLIREVKAGQENVFNFLIELTP